jgi:hypothetical protein
MLLVNRFEPCRTGWHVGVNSEVKHTLHDMDVHGTGMYDEGMPDICRLSVGENSMDMHCAFKMWGSLSQATQCHTLLRWKKINTTKLTIN